MSGAIRLKGASSGYIDIIAPDSGANTTLNIGRLQEKDSSGDISTGNITTTGYIRGPSTFTIDPAAYGDSTGTVRILGGLIVEGTTTTINSSTLTVDDLNITLASGAANAAAADGAGITIAGANATLTYNSTPDAWSFNKNVGIGTTSPETLLMIEQAGTYTGVHNTAGLKIRNAAATTGVDNPYGAISLSKGTGSAGIAAIGNHASDADIVGLGFFVHASATGTDSATRAMTIDANGNVGIGTSSPAEDLSIVGSASSKAFSVNTPQGRGFEILLGDAVGSTGPTLQTNTIAGFNMRSTAGGFMTLGVGAEHMRINSSGNVGMLNNVTIGTNTLVHGDANYKTLEIDGSFGGKINLRNAAQTVNYEWRAQGATGYFGSKTSHPVAFMTGSTERMRIDANGRITTPYQPRFHAYGAGSTSQNAVVVYPSTYVNTGSHYNTSNGRFTAPVAGDYLFFWSAIGASTNDVYRFFIRKNGSTTISGTANDIHLRLDTTETGSAYAPNGSRVQMFTLSANDYIDIYFWSDAGNSHYVGSDYVNFGGYLLG